MNTMYNQKTKGANSLYDKKYDEVWFRLYNKSVLEELYKTMLRENFFF